MFGKTMPVNCYTAAVLLCFFFKVTFRLPDWIVKIITDFYTYIYLSEMAPLIKVKVINKAKGPFGQQINQNWPKRITKQSGHCNIIEVSMLVVTVAQSKGQSVKGQGQIGSYDSLVCYL